VNAGFWGMKVQEGLLEKVQYAEGKGQIAET